MGRCALVDLSHDYDDGDLEVLRDVKLVNGSLWDLWLGRIDNHHDVVRAVTADTLNHRLSVLLVARNVDEGQDLLGFLKDLLLAQELEVIDVRDFPFLIESEDAVVNRRSIPIQNGMLVAFDCDAGASLSVVTLACHENTKEGALACIFGADEEDLDVEL